ncbi:hypothetical protein [Flavobacterium mesophilum]|uniref:hypothetical protein n=1 Tax=Flavobacterium mesophilum TaxID=3143495 RepID=UPI0031D37F72
MKPHTTSSQNFNFIKSFSSDNNFIDAEFHSEKQHPSQIHNLYYKHEDEPDFDCEFLPGISYDLESIY